MEQEDEFQSIPLEEQKSPMDEVIITPVLVEEYSWSVRDKTKDSSQKCDASNYDLSDAYQENPQVQAAITKYSKHNQVKKQSEPLSTSSNKKRSEPVSLNSSLHHSQPLAELHLDSMRQSLSFQASDLRMFEEFMIISANKTNVDQNHFNHRSFMYLTPPPHP